MRYFLLILFLFLVGAMIGYFLEVLFRRFITAHKWVNPGFMKGPWLPLYGFGLLVMFGITIGILTGLRNMDLVFYNPNGRYDFIAASGPTVYDLITIALMTVGMILLEFIAGLIFVKGFKVKLWDYSNLRGNIMGIICPQFNLIWFAVAVVFYYGISPFVYHASIIMYNYMFGDTRGGDVAHFGFIFFLGVVYGIMLIDLIYSTNIFNKISKYAKKSGITARYEKLQEDQKRQREEAKEKFFNSIPQTLKSALDTASGIGNNKVVKKSKNFLMRMIFINPEAKEKPGDNYDENGRPLGSVQAKKKDDEQ